MQKFDSADYRRVFSSIFKPKTLGVGLFLTLFFPVDQNRAYADLLELGDDHLARINAQSGLTIDIETKVTIAELEYVDAGSIYWKDISLSGIDGGLADNIRAYIDIAGPNEILPSGFSYFAQLADLGLIDSTLTDVAWSISEYSDGSGNFGKRYGDGSAFIHIQPGSFGFEDQLSTRNITQGQNFTDALNAIDLRFSTSEFGLRSSDGAVETSLTNRFSADAYLGYLDILITNNGNGFHASNTDGEPAGVSAADSYIQYDMRFRVEDLDIENSNNADFGYVPRFVTMPGLTIKDMRIHNERGADTLGSFGYARIQTKTGAVTDILKTGGVSPEFVDGVAVYDVNVEWDWDIPDVSFGDTAESIGEVYITDFAINDTSLVISGH